MILVFQLRVCLCKVEGFKCKKKVLKLNWKLETRNLCFIMESKCFNTITINPKYSDFRIFSSVRALVLWNYTVLKRYNERLANLSKIQENLKITEIEYQPGHCPSNQIDNCPFLHFIHQVDNQFINNYIKYKLRFESNTSDVRCILEVVLDSFQHLFIL